MSKENTPGQLFRQRQTRQLLHQVALKKYFHKVKNLPQQEAEEPEANQKPTILFLPAQQGVESFCGTKSQWDEYYRKACCAFDAWQKEHEAETQRFWAEEDFKARLRHQEIIERLRRRNAHGPNVFLEGDREFNPLRPKMMTLTAWNEEELFRESFNIFSADLLMAAIYSQFNSGCDRFAPDIEPGHVVILRKNEKNRTVYHKHVPVQEVYDELGDLTSYESAVKWFEEQSKKSDNCKNAPDPMR